MVMPSAPRYRSSDAATEFETSKNNTSAAEAARTIRVIRVSYLRWRHDRIDFGALLLSRAVCGDFRRRRRGCRHRVADVLRDAVDVRDRLAEWRHAVVLPDVAFAGVVGGDGEIGVATEGVQEPAQVADACVDVRGGIV